MTWEEAKFFNEPFISIGNWDLTKLTKFPTCKYLSADTETKLYLNNELLTEEKAYELYKANGQAWCKENFTVKAYAFMLSDGENFALFQNCEDFLTACAMFHVKQVFWYNAKFDFAIFDYYMLSNGWHSADDVINSNKRHYRKLPDKTFQSLNGDFGQRYKLRIWKQYKNKKGSEKVHNFAMVDICNIYGGGLAKNLEDWKITDRNGNPVRKLEMDYVEADVEADLQYMINDTKGLHLLAEKIDSTLYEISGFSLFKGDYITAGGLAKKSLLEHMFKQGNHKKNIEMFKEFFPMTVEEDKDFREHKLYLGGKCLVNPNKLGKVQHNIYKYDVNSMYPDKMRNMDYPLGKPTKLKNLLHKDDKHIYIVATKNIVGIVKDKMVPVWPDGLTNEYVDTINEPELRYFWLEELEELDKWYDLDYDIEYVLEYKKCKPKGVIEYVDEFYGIKCNSKGAIKNGAKLFLNSAYGKIAQRLERQICYYELTPEGYVHLAKGEIEIDENSMLSVVVGSRITALARVHLMYYMRTITKGNPKDYFIYCDTDSVHALTPFDDTDDKELGKMKCEGIFSYGIYLAPKSYLMYDNKEADGIKEKRYQYEVHCKGVNTKVVKNLIGNSKFSEAVKIFRPNKTFRCLSALNVKGGKALIYVDKMIVNDKNYELTQELLGDLEEAETIY